MNINRIIVQQEVIIKYQPIMSTHNKNFLGLEALVRGCINGKEISPFDLFNAAILNDQVLALDKLCIKKSIEGFRDFYRFNPSTLLFINVDATVMDYYINSNFIESLLEVNEVNTSNVVLEINELKTLSLSKMKEFSVKYKNLGCLIALDDIGGGESNLDRIPLIRPDIMKIDKDLIKDLEKSFHRKQVVASIIELATNLGALVVLEGIETLSDIYHIAEFGAHLIQGYYLGKASDLNNEFYMATLENKTRIRDLMYKYNKDIYGWKSIIHEYMNRIANEMKTQIESLSLKKYKSSILEILYKYDVVESVYVLDMDGELLTDTIFNREVDLNTNSPLYRPCIKGDSVELEEYFTRIRYGGYMFWISSEYISMASGHKCYTYSSSFKKNINTNHIICIDFDSNKVNETLSNYYKEINYA